jgi:hypothetical protein
MRKHNDRRSLSCLFCSLSTAKLRLSFHLVSASACPLATTCTCYQTQTATTTSQSKTTAPCYSRLRTLLKCTNAIGLWVGVRSIPSRHYKPPRNRSRSRITRPLNIGIARVGSSDATSEPQEDSRWVSTVCNPGLVREISADHSCNSCKARKVKVPQSPPQLGSIATKTRATSLDIPCLPPFSAMKASPNVLPVLATMLPANTRRLHHAGDPISPGLRGQLWIQP